MENVAVKVAAVELCKVVGSGIEVAAVRQLAEFTITAFESDGRQLDRGGTSFFVAIRGPQRVRARITDNKDGTYRAGWTPPQSGNYSVAVSLFGVSLVGSPFAVTATPQLPFAPNCEVRGIGMAVARAMQTFEVLYKDRLGFSTHAVDLDVFAEPLPVGVLLKADDQAKVAPAEPEQRRQGSDTGDSEITGDSVKSKKKAMAEKKGKLLRASTPRTEVHVTTPNAASPSEIITQRQGESREEVTSEGDVRRRTIRVKARSALVIRESEEVDSAQIGVVHPGQIMTVVLEKVKDSKVRAMIALDTMSYSAEHSTPGTSPRNKKMAMKRLSGSIDVAGDPALPNSAVHAVPNSASGTDSHHEAEASGHEASGARGGALPAADSERLTARVGWVTLLKDGHKLVTSRVQESASHRQQSKEQWARRLKTDRQRGSLQDSGASSLPNVALEKSADPSGIGFAFGGISPGTLHAHGKLVEKHTVSYSIGLVGEYLLHVRLRQASIALPGSPFRLLVEPNVACARTSRVELPPNGRIEGLVGMTAGCGVTVSTYDLMGNRSICGGAVVTGEAVLDKLKDARDLKCEVTDKGDGTYYLQWRSNASGTYQVAIKVNYESVADTLTTIWLTSVTPLLSKTSIIGECIKRKATVAGQLSRFCLTFSDMYDNPAVPGSRFKFGLALIHGRSFKDVESYPFTMACIDEQACMYEFTFACQRDGAFDLHVWADDLCSTKSHQKIERVPLAGSPFPCAVSAGAASASMSSVDGWSKENRAVDKNGKAVDLRPREIIAGDAVIMRPSICDDFGNTTALEKGALDVKIHLPNGTIYDTSTPMLKLGQTVKGGLTLYDVRHEATHAGPHEVHLNLNGKPIRGSPVRFEVATSTPDVRTARLTPPTETTLYSSRTYKVLLKTFDRFNNPITLGGLQVGARLQLIKSSVHDLTTLVATNHKIEIEDNSDGTYNVLITVMKIAVTVKLIVNMDKNIPASGGELPAVQLVFLPDSGTTEPAASQDELSPQQKHVPTAEGREGGSATGAHLDDATWLSRTGNARLRDAGKEIVALMGKPDKPRALVALAADAFTEGAASKAKRAVGGKGVVPELRL